MDGEENNVKDTIKGVLKGISKKVVIVIIIISLILWMIPMFYVVLKDDFDKISEKNSTYSYTVNSQGQVTYIRTEEDEDGNKVEVEITAEDMAESFKDVLSKYIDSDDEEYIEIVTYLIEAETVTKLPYIKNLPEDKLNGQVKFYRYQNETQANNPYTADGETLNEDYMLEFIELDKFNKKLEAYRNGSDPSGEVFKYFSIDEEANVIIACGSVETRNITTDDQDLIVENVREVSGEESYSGNSVDGFSMVRYSASKKKIDYLSLVENYIMPSNLLYSLLIQTRDIEFVKAIAALAYENEIAIGIYDNESLSTKNEKYNYKKAIDNMNARISLNFDNINTTVPKINKASLYGSTYSKIPFQCYAYIKQGLAKHYIKYLKAWEGNEQNSSSNVMMYVGGIDKNNKIISLTDESSAKLFTTEFYREVNSKAISTYGVILADTWIARWKASYKKVEVEPSSSSSNGTYEDFLVAEYSELLNEFIENKKTEMTDELNTHADELKKKAIDRIVEQTDFTVTPDATDKKTVNDLSTAEKKQILKDHIGEEGNGYNKCNVCKASILTWWYSLTISQRLELPSFGAIYIALESNNGGLRGTVAYTHYTNALQKVVTDSNNKAKNEAETKAKEKAEKNKNKFIEELEEQISYASPQLKGEKYDVKIQFESSTFSQSTKYEKEETIETDKLGEKFSKVFNSKEFYDSRQAILQRTEWLWEYIRKNEDTAKLEDVIRILLNKATNSNKFGTFTEEEIEKLFKAFEPTRMIETTKIYGNSAEIKVWSALINAGYSKEAVAGAMGNIYAESGFDPSIIEGGTGIGFGLCQWSYDRRTQLEGYAEHKGVEPSDIDTQIEFLLTEITPGAVGPAQGYANYQLLSYNGYNGEKWMNADSPEAAAVAFCWSFERPGVPAIAKRQSKAREYYEKFKDFEEGGYYEKDTSSDARIIGRFTSSRTGRTFIIYNQLAMPGWGIWCNRAAQIAVCSGYWSGNDPIEDLINEGAGAPDGTMPRNKALYDSCNLTCGNGDHSYDTNEIREQIQSGGYVILYVKGTNYGHDGTSQYGRDWAGTAHWVSILGYRQLDSIEEIFVGDSGNGNTGWVPLDEFDGITVTVVYVNEK